MTHIPIYYYIYQIDLAQLFFCIIIDIIVILLIVNLYKNIYSKLNIQKIIIKS